MSDYQRHGQRIPATRRGALAASLQLTVAIGMIASVSASPASADSLPRIARDTPYSKARTMLLGLGYAPVTAAGAARCDAKGDPRCFPEQVDCAGSGLGQCIFAWRKGGNRIEIVTIGERPIVDIVR